MYVIIVGCGGIGKALATHLINEGNEVVIVEEDEDKAKAAAESIDAIVIHGDGSNVEILKDAGVDRADAVAVVTNDDNINLTVCQMLKKFNVPKIVARVNDPSKKDLYLGLEITAAISVVSAAVSHFKNALTKDKGRSMLSIAGGQAEVIEVKMSNEKLNGLKVKDLGLPQGSVVGAIYRNGEVIISTQDTIVRYDDTLTLVTKTEVIKDVMTILR